MCKYITELGYGTVSYLRFANTDGDVDRSFRISKKLLELLKTLSDQWKDVDTTRSPLDAVSIGLSAKRPCL